MFHGFRFDETDEFILAEDAAEQSTATHETTGGTHKPPNFEMLATADIDENEAAWRTAFYAEKNADIILRRFMTGKHGALAVYMDGITKENTINDMILRPLMETGCKGLQDAMDRILPVKSLTIVETGREMVMAVIDGNAVIQMQGDSRALVAEVRNYAQRSVGETVHEKVLKGPQQGFVESLRTNVSLIRGIVRTADLITEMLPPSGDNNLKCALLYRNGVAPKKLVDRVRDCVLQANGKGFVLGSGMMEQLMNQHAHTFVPQTLQTERPDRTAAYLTSGHVALVCEGYPFVMVLPVTFFSLMQTSDDYFISPMLGTAARCVRYGSLIIAMFLPAIYLAIITYHRELFSVKFLITSQALRQLVPMPIFVEILLMGGVFELLREASLRVQRGVNQTLGIIGGIILGQAAITANIVSPMAIIIVAATGLASYAIPDYSLQMIAYRLRLVLIVAALLGGFWGLVLVYLPMMALAGSTRSYGVAFFAPVAPRTRHGKDLIIKGRAGETGTIEDYITGSDVEMDRQEEHAQ